MMRRAVSVMSFDPSLLFLSLVASGVGFVLFVYGRKQERWPHLVAGLVFMIYPYFTNSILALLAAGGILGFALWYVVRLGW
jgi:hypothetical protein